MSTLGQGAGDDTTVPMPSIAAEYRPAPGVYDELLAPDGSIRPHWRSLLDALESMRPAETRRRWAMAEQLMHENGISFNVFSDPGAPRRPWQFDGIPLIIPPDEWDRLEAGVTQRAHLLNQVLADIYGPQRLMREGWLPPAVVLGSPGFLRPCHGIAPRGGIFLHSYAVDLARGPDGSWWVLRDSTGTPEGAGYSLENRIVLSQCLPEAFATRRVRRLAEYHLEAHEHLVALSGRDDPRIVLLSPGPRNESFFAHAYIARYLGYTLAEGEDLTVRSDRVFLKTVDGLMPVDVIVRGIDSAGADPLVLRADSYEGVAGLVRAAGADTVVVANAIGSGVVGCSALMAFMPAIARHVLGEDLLLDNIATWWAGDERARDHVLANIDNLAIRPALDVRGQEMGTHAAWTTAELTAGQRDALMARLAGRGNEFVGQELVAASTAPVWEGQALRPRPVMLRLFVSASADGYQVMPGGLARISETDEARAIAVDRGDRTKDVWVLSDAPVSPLSLIRTPLSIVNLRRTGRDLPSRAADNLFWLGRYAERAEDSMRLVRAVVARLSGDGGLTSDFETMERLTGILVAKAESVPGSPAPGRSLADAPLETRLVEILYAPDLAFGVRETIVQLKRTAALARDRLSLDAWRILGDEALGQPWQRRRGQLQSGIVLAELNAGLRALSAFSGLEMENMTRSHGWRFIDMGRRIERAVHTAELLRGVLAVAEDAHDPRLIMLLDVVDSFMTYRSRYVSTPMLAPVVDLLMLDETNPRSLAHQLAMLAEHVDSLPRADRGPSRTPEQKIALSLVTGLRLCDIAELCHRAGEGRLENLERLLDHILAELPRLSDLIARSYFSHAAVIHTGGAQSLEPAVT
jgi:uncharacterized circularly permuted ATP-grasp superfamily protein/uncharacterized alpha-E superfamily protein